MAARAEAARKSGDPRDRAAAGGRRASIRGNPGHGGRLLAHERGGDRGDGSLRLPALRGGRTAGAAEGSAQRADASGAGRDGGGDPRGDGAALLDGTPGIQRIRRQRRCRVAERGNRPDGKGRAETFYTGEMQPVRHRVGHGRVARGAADARPGDGQILQLGGKQPQEDRRRRPAGGAGSHGEHGGENRARGLHPRRRPMAGAVSEAVETAQKRRKSGPRGLGPDARRRHRGDGMESGHGALQGT